MTMTATQKQLYLRSEVKGYRNGDPVSVEQAEDRIKTATRRIAKWEKRAETERYEDDRQSAREQVAQYQRDLRVAEGVIAALSSPKTGKAEQTILRGYIDATPKATPTTKPAPKARKARKCRKGRKPATLAEGQTQKRFVTVNGRRRAAWFRKDHGEIFVAFTGSEEFHRVSSSQNFRQFTHGGELYRAACRRSWEFYG